MGDPGRILASQSGRGDAGRELRSRETGIECATPAPRINAPHGPTAHQGRTEKMSFVKEFREFAVKGNVVDLAVGVIIGAAFSKIVDSVVKDLIMPIVGRFIGGLDFSNYFIKLADPPPGYTGPMTYEALTKAGVPLFAYGNFITVAINFAILAFIIFWMVKAINRLRRDTPPAPPAQPPEDIVLLRDIRDALVRK
jgi:large conductance mechanosensitive channel